MVEELSKLIDDYLRESEIIDKKINFYLRHWEYSEMNWKWFDSPWNNKEEIEELINKKANKRYEIYSWFKYDYHKLNELLKKDEFVVENMEKYFNGTAPRPDF